MEGQFAFQQPDPAHLVLDGQMDGHPVQMRLALFDRNTMLLVSRGFHWIQEYSVQSVTSPIGSPALDAIVIGSGPNGLAAAIALARAGRSVRVYEAEADHRRRHAVCRADRHLASSHDICSAVHSMVPSSPFLKSLPLAEHGLALVQPGVPFAHPFDDGTAAIGRAFGGRDGGAARRGADARAYRNLLGPFVDRADDLIEALLAPFGLRHSLLMARFGTSRRFDRRPRSARQRVRG